MAEETQRLFDHLKANEVDIENDRLTMGADLNLDPESQLFTGPASEWANMYQKRLYRPPFVIPEKV